MPDSRGDAAGTQDTRAQALGVKGRARHAAAIAGADGSLLVSIQAGGQHLPKGQGRIVWEGRGDEGRHLHSPAAGVLLHQLGGTAGGAELYPVGLIWRSACV